MSHDVALTCLDSGARVITERLPHLRSIAVGYWVGTGSRDEPDELAGASHFLEHLLFKGTDGRTAADIADAVESIGGDMNAFTTHEFTTYYVRLPDRALALAFEILSDIMWSPALRPDDVESERQVILEEIAMRDDTPEDLVHDLFSSAMFPDHPIGREVVGSRETIGAMHRDDIAGFHAQHYSPSNVVIAAAGNLDHDEVVALVEAGLGGAPGARPRRTLHDGKPAPRALAILDRPIEQTHVIFGMRAIRRDDPDRYPLSVLNQVLGGGMSSRLFQEVRERRGLAYSVYSFRAAYEETGALAVYAGTSPEHADDVLGIVRDEFDRIVRDSGVTPRELDAAKGNLTGSLALGLESSSSRMHRIGRSLLTLGEVPSVDDVVAEIEAVTDDDIARVVDRVLGGDERTTALVGPPR